MNTIFLNEIKSDNINIDELTKFEISLNGISSNYDKIDKMPVWPFDINIIFRLFGAVIIPILLLILQQFIEIAYS